jgi:hypothetical protein
MSDGLDAARALLPALRLGDPAPLASSDRASVRRVRATDAEGRESSVIVKQFHAGAEGWARETAALTVLPPELGGPRLLASGSTPPIVVMTDAGHGDNLAEALLGRDPDRAAASLARWAEAMAAVHVATRGLREQFRAALDERAGELPLHEARIGNDIDDAMRVLDRACGSLGVAVPGGAFDEVRELYHRLGADGAAALTPADACPDDNVAVDGGLVIVDYENAQWRHVAWDVAYLRVPWPTCWCSWRLPDDVADAAVAAYRRIAGASFPEVADAAFERDVEAAGIGWSLTSAMLFLDHALGNEQPLSGRYLRAPTRRAMIMHRLERAGRSSELPAAAELAGRLAEVLRAQWGAVRLDYAPAFR